jgi:hypothetical protein
MKRFAPILAAVALLAAQSSVAQHQELHERPQTWKGPSAGEDTTTLIYACKNGRFQGHFRYFFMATDNHGPLSDYYANAVGAGLRYQTAPWHRFYLAVSGFFIFNLLSSDLTRRDSATQQLSRYELGLFDIEDPGNRSDIDRLEELYLSYKAPAWELRLGRQLINTPFINLQDGRMRPTLAEGIWADVKAAKALRFESGWISRISPRSTVRWFRVGESIGVYPPGRQPDGSPGSQTGEQESRGVALAGVKARLSPRIQVQAWEMWTENISHSALLQADYSRKLKGGGTLKAAAQALGQIQSGEGGNPSPERAYYPEGGRALTWGARLGWERGPWELSLSYNRITDQGRYLMPREWGREPFFTFMPRERNEGLADSHAFVAQGQYKHPKLPLRASLAAGYFALPDPEDPQRNKYAMPSYLQANADLRYAFKDWLEGLELQLLLVGKHATVETGGNYRYLFNKAHMLLLNFVVNYHF